MHKEFAPGVYSASVAFPSRLLNTGKYYVSILFDPDLAGQDFLARYDELLSFEVVSNPTLYSGVSINVGGTVRMFADWTVAPLGDEVLL